MATQRSTVKRQLSTLAETSNKKKLVNISFAGGEKNNKFTEKKNFSKSEIPKEMFSLCRLCASCTDPIDLMTEISELEPRLVHCFGWRQSEKEIDMPKKACNSCVDRLQRSYDFVECMLMAEKQLNKLLNEQMQTVTDEFLPEIVDIKVEGSKRRMINPPVPDEIGTRTSRRYMFDANNTDPEKHDDPNYNKNETVEYCDDNDVIFTEPIGFSDDGESECSNKNSTKKVTAKKYRKKKRLTDESFLDALDIEDRLDGGLISADGVKKLEKLFPNMKTMSWQDCQYKCEKCDRIFRGSINFYAHIRSIHIEDVVSIIVPCVYCNSKHRREFTLNRHIASEHFIHLKYR